MKYMGSKRAMLTNGLGVIISDAIKGRDRFVDLFSGSGAVSRFAATNFDVPVLSVDLQSYAAVLSAAFLNRDSAINVETSWANWLDAASNVLICELEVVQFAASLDAALEASQSVASAQTLVDFMRSASTEVPVAFPFSRAYAGHYFSLTQALWLDALRRTVVCVEHKELAIAALIEASSECCAAPGHTAQPFSPTISGLPHLLSAWSKDLCARVEKTYKQNATVFAKRIGSAVVDDALTQAEHLTERDLVFIDPPYSEVQYSRFYHVLESVAKGDIGSVFGVGRYPPIGARPQSSFSSKAPAAEELDQLMVRVGLSEARAIVTFPEGDASNGLSGDLVEAVCSQYFSIKKRVVKSTFSTLGGTGKQRSARQGANELILDLVPHS
jgi:adenine-specific DNA-methyltransferase